MRIRQESSEPIDAWFAASADESCSLTKAMFTCFSCLLMVWHAIVLLLMFCCELSEPSANFPHTRIADNSGILRHRLE